MIGSSISVKTEAENMSIDESSFGHESDEMYSDDRFGRFSNGLGQERYDGFGRVFGGPGRGQETDDLFGFFSGGGQYSDDRFGRFFNGRGRGLNVGGRLAGGRCGSLGFCGQC